MKIVIYHYTVMRSIEVDDKYSTDNIYQLNDDLEKDGIDIDDLIISEKTDNCEIVDVEEF